MIVMFGIGGLVLFSSQSGVFQIPTCGALICGDTHDPSGHHSDSYYYFLGWIPHTFIEGWANTNKVHNI